MACLQNMLRAAIHDPVKAIVALITLSLTGDYIWTPFDSLDLRPLRRETSMLTA